MGFPKTPQGFQAAFPHEEACWEALRRARWPRGLVCPRCGHAASSWVSTRRLEQCRGCRYQCSVTAGTVFHRSRVALLGDLLRGAPQEGDLGAPAAGARGGGRELRGRPRAGAAGRPRGLKQEHRGSGRGAAAPHSGPGTALRDRRGVVRGSSRPFRSRRHRRSPCHGPHRRLPGLLRLGSAGSSPRSEGSGPRSRPREEDPALEPYPLRQPQDLAPGHLPPGGPEIDCWLGTPNHFPSPIDFIVFDDPVEQLIFADSFEQIDRSTTRRIATCRCRRRRITVRCCAGSGRVNASDRRKASRLVRSTASSGLPSAFPGPLRNGSG